MNVYKYTYIKMYDCVHIYACMYIYIYIYIYMYECVNIIYLYIYIMYIYNVYIYNVYIYIYIYTGMNVYNIYIYTCMVVYMNIYIYIIHVDPWDGLTWFWSFLPSNVDRFSSRDGRICPSWTVSKPQLIYVYMYQIYIVLYITGEVYYTVASII